MSSRVMQCKQCSRIFQSYGPNICPVCAEELDKSFQKVKNYLFEHPQANVIDICNGTDVSEKTVLYFLKEGRLAVDGMSFLECDRCGEPISKGRFCSRCQAMFEKELDRVATKPKQEGALDGRSGLGRMHFDYRKE